MTTATITLNPGTGGALPAVDTLTTVDGVAAPAGAVVQLMKMGWGVASDLKSVTPATPSPVATYNNGFFSTLNSTSIALAANAVFIGTWEEITEQADIRTTVFADQASATDGLSIQQSSNGTNADILDAYSIPAGTGKIFTTGASAKFFRNVYTNGPTAQTVLRLQTKLNKTYGRASSVRPQDARPRDNDMDEVLSYLMAWNGTNFDMLRSSIANGLAVDVTRMAELRATTQWVSATGVSGAAVTASLPAAGAGQFHYITTLIISLYAAAARTGAATPSTVTTTNLPGSPAFSFPTAQAIGAIDRRDIPFTTPVKSAVANTATTVAAAVATGGIWRINVGYFTGA